VVLAATDANVASAKDRKSQRILQQAAQRALAIIAIHTNDAHQIGYDTDCRLRPEDLGLDRKLVRTG
jgi:glutamine synthetase adenylyltransferase